MKKIIIFVILLMLLLGTASMLGDRLIDMGSLVVLLCSTTLMDLMVFSLYVWLMNKIIANANSPNKDEDHYQYNHYPLDSEFKDYGGF